MVKEKMKKINRWNEKYLTRVGKEVLVKAIAQAIPCYVMSYYKLPIKEIKAMPTSLRILNDKSSLLSKVLKGKYFPRCSIAEASMGHSPSFVWRSILGYRETFENGT
ncbi:unnamed protein product [Lathyrus sativus]|nr:unnamed protein product [Lathyrus sativus]